ncbi:MAG: hypothetical protein ACR2FY_23140 [Pirellulaceae bacterium]
MSLVHPKLMLFGVFASLLALAAAAQACPICPAAGLTFAEEFDSMDVVVVARLIAIPAKAAKGDLPLGKFEITRVLKGEKSARLKETIETLYLGEAKVGTSFLIMGVDPPNLQWSTPLPLSDRAPDYLAKIVKLPKDGQKRLEFFQSFLEDEDEMLARDAYGEFAKAPYAAVQALQESMSHDKLVGWIKDTTISLNHRRLYLMMLGVCGSEKDAPLLEKYIKSTDRKEKQGLDAIIACYLQLRGEAGLPLIEDLFLKDKKSDYADTYAAIMALRFQLSDGKAVPKQGVLAALHHMLERPDLADLIIPDLARWEDWGQADKLFALYKNSDEKSTWVRVPVVAYLRVCPLPKAKELLRECEKIDPQAVKRANSLFLITPTPAVSAVKS